MIKKCKVTLCNSEVIVFEFDEKLIQISNKNNIKADFIFIKYEDEKYNIVTEKEYEKSLIKPKEKIDGIKIKD